VRFFVSRPDHFVRFNLVDAISPEACDRARLWSRHLLKPSSHRSWQKVSYAQLSSDYECDSRATPLDDPRFIEIRGLPKRRANEQDARLITERHGKRAFERKTRCKAR